MTGVHKEKEDAMPDTIELVPSGDIDARFETDPRCWEKLARLLCAAHALDASTTGALLAAKDGSCVDGEDASWIDCTLQDLVENFPSDEVEERWIVSGAASFSSPGGKITEDWEEWDFVPDYSPFSPTSMEDVRAFLRFVAQCHTGFVLRRIKGTDDNTIRRRHPKRAKNSAKRRLRRSNTTGPP